MKSDTVAWGLGAIVSNKLNMHEVFYKRKPPSLISLDKIDKLIFSAWNCGLENFSSFELSESMEHLATSS